VQPKQNISLKCKVVPDSFCYPEGSTGRKSSEVCKYGMNANVGLLINSSRGIIYASTVLILQKSKSSVENATGNG
jgi:hypothetical protein